MKNENFIFRIDEDEKNMLETKARLANVSRAELLRKFIRDENIMIYDKEAVQAIKNLVNEVNSIGVNINQIVHNVNMGKYSDYEKKKLFAMNQVIIEKITELVEKYYG